MGVLLSTRSCTWGSLIIPVNRVHSTGWDWVLVSSCHSGGFQLGHWRSSRADTYPWKGYIQQLVRWDVRMESGDWAARTHDILPNADRVASVRGTLFVFTEWRGRD